MSPITRYFAEGYCFRPWDWSTSKEENTTEKVPCCTTAKVAAWLTSIGLCLLSGVLPFLLIASGYHLYRRCTAKTLSGSSSCSTLVGSSSQGSLTLDPTSDPRPPPPTSSTTSVSTMPAKSNAHFQEMPPVTPNAAPTAPQNQAKPTSVLLATSSAKVQIRVELDQIQDYIEKSLGREFADFQGAANLFTVQQGQIANQKGIIQDPAGSAVGSALFGGGLSGVIYAKGKTDTPPMTLIPRMKVGESCFNSSTGPFSRRVLHTYCMNFNDKKTDGTPWTFLEAIQEMSRGYQGAIRLFLDKKDTHQQTVLNLCAISSAIYGGEFAREAGRHVDPSMTLLALTMAIADLQKENKNFADVEIKLFYQAPTSSNSKQTAEELKERAQRANSVQSALKALPIKESLSTV